MKASPEKQKYDNMQALVDAGYYDDAMQLCHELKETYEEKAEFYDEELKNIQKIKEKTFANGSFFISSQIATCSALSPSPSKKNNSNDPMEIEETDNYELTNPNIISTHNFFGQTSSVVKKKKTPEEKERKNQENAATGKLGEQYAYDDQKRYYEALGFHEINKKEGSNGCHLIHPITGVEIKIIWCNKYNESTLPYDLLIRTKRPNSKEENEFIEVKSTKNDKPSNARFSKAQLEMVRNTYQHFRLFRVYNVTPKTKPRLIEILDLRRIRLPYQITANLPDKISDKELPPGSLAARVTELKIKI